MNWQVQYHPDALKDLKKLDGSQQVLVKKAIRKVSGNPLPASEGGYGKPLGNKHQNNLSGLLKVRLKGAGLRIVYSLIRTQHSMYVVVIGIRDDDEVYRMASKRILPTKP